MTETERLLLLLLQSQVEFVVIGGIAAIAHGSARVTYDLDIVYRRTPENLERVVAALRPHDPYLRGAPPGLPFRWDAATLKRGLNFTGRSVTLFETVINDIPRDHFIHHVDFTTTQNVS